jgi:hypothetical protein
MPSVRPALVSPLDPPRYQSCPVLVFLVYESSSRSFVRPLTGCRPPPLSPTRPTRRQSSPLQGSASGSYSCSSSRTRAEASSSPPHPALDYSGPSGRRPSPSPRAPPRLHSTRTRTRAPRRRRRLSVGSLVRRHGRRARSTACSTRSIRCCGHSSLSGVGRW